MAAEWILTPRSAVAGTSAAASAAPRTGTRLHLLSELGAFGLGEMDPSAVYRLLRDMEGRGWVDSDWDEERTQGPPRRVYRLTAQGNEMLGWWMADLRETAEIIARMLDNHKRHMEDGAGDYH